MFYLNRIRLSCLLSMSQKPVAKPVAPAKKPVAAKNGTAKKAVSSSSSDDSDESSDEDEVSTHFA